MDYKFKTEPFAHQAEAFCLSRDKPVFAFLMEMGTAKSKICIDTAAWLWLNGKIQGLLIICPNGIQDTVWRKQIITHMPNDIPWQYLRYKGTGKGTAEFNASFPTVYSADCLNVLTMNIEAIRYKKTKSRGYEVAEEFLNLFPSLMIVDEAHSLKDSTTSQSRCAMALGMDAKYRRILTGTSITKNALDLFGQYRFLDFNILGLGQTDRQKKSFWHFQHRYGMYIKQKMTKGKKEWEFQKLIGFANIDELQNRIGPYTYHKDKSVLDLPEKIHSNYPVKFTGEQERYYKQLVREGATSMNLDVDTFEDILAAQLNGDEHPTIFIKNALEKELRLQQLLCGRFKDANQIVTDINHNRLSTLLEIVDNTEGKIIIWARFIDDIKTIVKSLRESYGDDSVGAYYGEVSDEDRDYVVEAFEDLDSPLRFFVGEPSTGGLGLTLIAGTTTIYYSQSYRWVDRKQSEDRSHRPGQKHNCTYITLFVPDTVDEKIMQNHLKKAEIADEFYAGLN